MSQPRPTSVVRSDPEALAVLLSVHAAPGARIVDVTHNRGRMWRGLPYQPLRLDLDPDGALFAAGHIDERADFRALPVEAASVDVLVFDPPHVTEAGRGLVGEAGYADRYGTRGPELAEEDISAVFRPFLLEAQRVLAPGGIVLAKIADQVHRGVYRWQARAFQNTAEALGLVCCDLLVKVRPSAMVDPKWRNTYHVRKVHTYWLVVRNGTACQRKRSAA